MDSLDPMQSPPAACDCGSWEFHLGRDLGSLLHLEALIHCQNLWQGMVLARGCLSPLPGMDPYGLQVGQSSAPSALSQRLSLE